MVRKGFRGLTTEILYLNTLILFRITNTNPASAIDSTAMIERHFPKSAINRIWYTNLRHR